MADENDLYYNRVTGKKINDIQSDVGFQRDLIKFFQSDRHGYSKETILEKGLPGLVEDFAEHMRYQENNEVSAIKDLYFASNKEERTAESRDAFGRLMAAWDNSEGTEMSFGKAFDYVESIGSAPSTWASLITAGTGKLAAKVTSKGAQIATRRAVAATIARETAGQAARRGAIQGAVAEGAFSGATEAINQGTRVNAIEGYDFDTGTVALSTIAGGVLGGAGGAATRMVTSKKANQAIDLLEERAKGITVRATEQATAAKATVSAAPRNLLDQFIEQMTDYNTTVAKAGKALKKGAAKLDPLPTDVVEAGELIRRTVMNGPTDGKTKTFTVGGLSSDAVQSLAAAYVDIHAHFKTDPEKRISNIIADAIAEGRMDDVDAVKVIREKYGLSTDEFSHVFMAELSNAGRLLNAAGQVAKKTKPGTAQPSKKALDQTQAKFDGLVNNAKILFAKRVSTVSDEKVDDVVKNIAKDKVAGLEFLKGVDSLRIGFMTSQLATTAANVAFSGGRLTVDVADRFFYNITKGQNPFKGTFSTIGALTWDKYTADALALMADTDAPESIGRLISDVFKSEAIEGSSKAAKIGQTVNYFNGLTDNIFKKAVLLSSIDRQLMDLGDEALGKSFKDFTKKNLTLDKLPDDVVKNAVNDALEYTFQKSYRGEKTYFARGSQAVMKAHKAVPFAISSAMPFPRFIANQLEFLHDYMPGVGVLGIGREMLYGAVESKSMQDRIARQMTGVALLSSAYAFRTTQGTESKYNQYVDDDGVHDLSRIAGPMNVFLLVADAIYRYKNEEELDYSSYKMGVELAELTGSTGFIPDSSPIMNLFRSLTTGEDIKSVGNLIPDFIATFTYPLATFNDVYGQIDPRSSEKPYTKIIGGEETVNFFDLIEVKASTVARASRFIPDVPWSQINESLEGNYDLQYFTPFNNQSIRKVNPLVTQFTGVTNTPKQSEIQADINRFNLEEYKLSMPNENPSIDYAVNFLLSSTEHVDLPKQWVNWKEANQEEWDSYTPELKQTKLKAFIASVRQETTANVTESFNYLAENNPVKVAGYIKNMYITSIRKHTREDGIAPSEIIKAAFGQTNEEYIAGAESLEDQLTRMQQIMYALDNAAKANVKEFK